MGSAEYVAEHIAEILEKYGFDTEVTYGPSLKELPTKGIWLIVCSTHGAGDLPENIQPLAKEISQDGASDDDLSLLVSTDITSTLFSQPFSPLYLEIWL